MRLVGSTVNLDDVTGVFAPLQFDPIKTAMYPKDVFIIVPDFKLGATSTNGEVPFFVRFPLMARKHQNGNVLIRTALFPLWMPEDKRGAVFRDYYFVDRR